VQIRVDWTSRTIKGGMVLKSLLLERNSSPTKHILFMRVFIVLHSTVTARELDGGTFTYIACSRGTV
jgi:hypothetical protein